VAQALTLLAVVFAWVVFRATSLDAALAVWAGMLGLNGIDVPVHVAALLARFPSGLLADLPVFSPPDPLTFYLNWVGIAVCALICLRLPNSLEIMATVDAATAREHEARLLPRFGQLWQSWTAPALTGLILFVAVSRIQAAAETEFLYYQF
jgi:hypothetical protein